MTGHRPLTASAVSALALALSACALIADPGPTAQPVPPQPVAILSSVTPKQGVLTTWPTRFVIPVFEIDPTQQLKWEAFEYFGAVSNGGTQIFASEALLSSSSEDGGIVSLITITSLPEPPPTGCPTIEIIVYPAGSSPTDPLAAAVVQWLYAPLGLAACGGYDAGSLADGSFPDAGEPDVSAADGGS